MAFDDKTRGRLQKLVATCRSLLTDEFRIQVQQTYGLDPNTGDVTPLERLTHLSAAERETADLLRQTLAHYLASEGLTDSAAHRVPVIDRIVREQAFTVLNRLAALLMMEARGVLQRPAVGAGQQSPAFELYKMVAGSALGETGQAYRTFLFSVFDEFSQELPALFDRFAPQGRLFPREATLLLVLAELNHHEIQQLWGEDETIGWIYQYFNSKEERKAMRDASQAPRNSRELAVRNQFFTPRYVVEFLVDNTLGRLWFNATDGQTSLRERCQYLLVKPDERPAAALRLRDPRTLKLLDPACGSMHFGLYAFDLFLTIYREAWDWEQSHGAGSLDVSTQPDAGFQPLCQSYADQAAYLRDVPRLVIEHNIHGVDIDPRAAQIASLALWLRAQRAWHSEEVKAKDRPAVGQGHVIAAAAPPAERELRDRFAERLDGPDAELFEKTLQMLKSAPELGVLLRVERELPRLVRAVFGEHGSLFKDADVEQWNKAEARLRGALKDFAQAGKATYQGRLFAQDALQGLRLIDLCRVAFDVVVMNPPFGLPSKRGKEYIDDTYVRARNDLLCVFIDRAVELLASGGYLGCITSRTVFFLSSFSEWREKTLLESAPPTLVADLGGGVLDAAMVETAAYCLKKGGDSSQRVPFLRLHQAADRANMLAAQLRSTLADGQQRELFELAPIVFKRIPGSPFSYWIGEEIRCLFGKFDRFESHGVVVRVTNPTADNFRYLRNYWECTSNAVGEKLEWVPYAKGGSSKKYYYDVNLLAMWDHRVPTYKGYQGTVHRSDIRPASLDYFFRSGIMWPLRAPRLCAQAFPKGTAFSARSQCLFAPESELPYFLGLMNSSTLDYLFKAALGRTDFPEFVVGALRNLPKPTYDSKLASEISQIALRVAELSRESATFDEMDHMFLAPRLCHRRDLESLRLVAQTMLELEQERAIEVAKCEKRLDDLVFDAYGLSDSARREIIESAKYKDCRASEAELSEEQPSSLNSGEGDEQALGENAGDISEQGRRLFSWLVGCVFSRWRMPVPDGGPKPALFGRQPIASVAQKPNLLNPDYKSITVDDPDDPNDIIRGVRTALSEIWGSRADAIEHELCQFIGVKDLRSFCEKVNGFFDFHLQQYSKSGRKAPIYWPLSTASGSYTLWVYYPRISSQTLYTAIIDFVEPKLKQVGEDVTALRSKGSARTRDDEKQFEALQGLEVELLELRDKLQEIAPGYKPKHDDGVQITAAPLWPLFRHKPWQKVLKDTWARLEKGDFDWAHLAMAYWPDRVREKCKTDKSLAIAHGLEDLYVEPEAAPKKTRGRKRADT